MTCPELLILSQLLDAELSPPLDGTSVRQHVATCAACRARLARLESATAAARSTLTDVTPPTFVGQVDRDCLAPEQLAAWAGRALAGDDLRISEAHLERCDSCLGEAQAALRLLSALDAGGNVPVPHALRARVAARWAEAPSREPLTELVIRVARAGAALVAHHVVRPILGVEELMVPVAASRADGDPVAGVSFRIKAPDAQICATVVPQGDAVGVSLSLLGSDDLALAGQRVFLRRHGRSLYSARTDATGALSLPRITPGVYEVSCPGIGTSFRLDLRP